MSDSQPTRILVIDDEEDVRNFITYNLTKDGFLLETAENGRDGLIKALQFKPTLILLDVMMPDIDGIEVCRQLRDDREFDQTIIAFLTARGEDYTQVAALDHGGDDFIVKPIKPNVLRSRINALLRRHKRAGTDNDQIYQIGELLLDQAKFEITLKGEAIEFAKKEFQILELLMSSPGKVFSRQEIFRKIWDSEIIVGERTIDVHVRRIREKVGDHYIKTLKGVGYKIEV
ncbi:MAG: response regulator transcription factor [Saprospiraceae bacterium]|nr:response regulator transcription factor [Saprospiraceae bacterium]